MNRWGYAVLIVVLMVLTGYVLWPNQVAADTQALWQGDAPHAFTVRDPALTQVVDGDQVELAGLHRKLNDDARQRLFNVFQSLSIPTARIVDGVTNDSQLAAYGIDRQHGIDAGSWSIRWGSSGAHGYLWDGKRVYTISTSELTTITTAARRLDDHRLLPDADTIDQLRQGALCIERRGGLWVDVERPKRPGLQLRMSRLLGKLESLTLDSLAATPRSATPATLTVDLTVPSQSHQHHLAFYDAAAGAVIQLDDLPSQAINVRQLDEWKSVIADLHHDWLLDLDGAFAMTQVKSFTVSTPSATLFTAERREKVYLSGASRWELSWDGGRENASEDSIARCFVDLGAVAVIHADPGPDPAPATPFARCFRLTMQNDSVVEMTIDGDRAWTPWYHGHLLTPTTLANVQAAQLLDLALVDAAPERICKLQRQTSGSPGTPPLQEVVTRDDNGTWSTTFPSRAPADVVAIGRLSRALCASHARSVRLSDAEDRAALEKPFLQINLRLTPRSEGAPSMEIADERDTVFQDRGFAFYQDAGKRWHAVDIDGGVSYQVDQEVVDVLAAPLVPDAVFPLVPNLVTRIEYQAGDDAFVLERSGDDWVVDRLKPDGAADAASAARPADPHQVRRYLRTLAELTAVAREPAVDVILPVQASLTVSVVMPARDGEERLILTMKDPGVQGAEISVSSTRAKAQLPPGRMRISADSARALLVPRSFFAPSMQ